MAVLWTKKSVWYVYYEYWRYLLLGFAGTIHRYVSSLGETSYSTMTQDTYVGAVDQGTTGTRFIVFDHSG